jgi:hypothetical protein
MIPANARQSVIAQANLIESEGESKIPDSPVVVEDCTTEVTFAVFRSIVVFILVQIHWAGG